MRLSRRASHAPSLQTPLLPGPSCSHCIRPLSIFPAFIRCAEPVCQALPLCPDCFSVGAYDILPHLPSHPYRVVEMLHHSLYAKDWALHEEERLLHALCEHGPHHWKQVSDYVRSKTHIKCERHYQHVYLDGPMAPLPTEPVASDLVAEPPSPAPAAEGKKPITSDPDIRKVEERTVKPGVKAGVFEGFMPKRGDFDVEWDDNAESVVSNLTISPADTEEELDLKMRLLENYDRRLKKREAIRHILLNHDLLDFSSHKTGGSRTARDEKELASRLKVFSRLLHKSAYTAVQDSLTNTYRHSREVHRLAQARDAGVHRLAETDIYEAERKTRASSLAASSKARATSRSRKRASSMGASSSAKRTKKNNHTLPSRDTLPTTPLDLRDSLHLVYAPTSEVDGLPPWLNAHDLIAADIAHTPQFNDHDADADADAELGEKADGVPHQSKTAKMRREREKRRMMRSTYPQVEPADVQNMPGASELTQAELVLCCSLKLAPEDFLSMRDAMLTAFNNGIASSAASESARGRIITMRASKAVASASNGDISANTRVQVTHRPMTRSTSAAASTSEMAREAVKPGGYFQRRVTRVIGANNALSAPAAMQPFTNPDVTNVDLERVQTRSQTNALLQKLESDAVSSATRLEALSELRGEDSRRCNKEASPSNTGRKQRNSSSGTCERRESRVLSLEAGGEMNKKRNPCAGHREGVRTLDSGVGDSRATIRDVPDIVCEGVGRSGIRLVLSLRLPKGDKEDTFNATEQREEVDISIDIMSEKEKDEITAVLVPAENKDQSLQNPLTPPKKASALSNPKNTPLKSEDASAQVGEVASTAVLSGEDLLKKEPATNMEENASAGVPSGEGLSKKKPAVNMEENASAGVLSGEDLSEKRPGIKMEENASIGVLSGGDLPKNKPSNMGTTAGTHSRKRETRRKSISSGRSRVLLPGVRKNIGQDHAGVRSRGISRKGRRVTSKRAAASRVVDKPQVIIVESAVCEEEDQVATLPVKHTEPKTEVTEAITQGFADDVRHIRKVEEIRGEKVGRRLNLDTEEEGNGSRVLGDFDRFAGGDVQEEVLEEGNADSMGRKGTGIIDISSGVMVARQEPNTNSQLKNHCFENNDSYLYIPPPRTKFNAFNNKQYTYETPQSSEDRRIELDEIVSEVQIPGLAQCSEPHSPAESASNDDEGDPSVDFSLTEELSEDDDDENEKHTENTPRRRRDRKSTGATPKRASTRIRRQRGMRRKTSDNPQSARRSKRAQANAVDEEKAREDDDAIEIKPSAKKPPVTPVRKSARKKRSRTVGEEDELPDGSPKSGRYSLRRRC